MFSALVLLGLLVVAGCVGGIFFFSLSEAALVSLSEVTLRRLIEEGDHRAQTVRHLIATGEYLSTLVVGLTACVMLASTITTLVVRAALPGPEDWRGTAIHFGMVALILVVGELVPKTYGSVFAERVALRVAGPVTLIMRPMLPLTHLLNSLCHFVFRMSGMELLPARHRVTSDEIKAAADMGEEEGIVDRQEGEMLDSLIELTEAEVREVMVPRVEMVALPITAGTDEIIGTAIESGFSRIPVYEGDIDHVIGIVYVKDLLASFAQGIHPVNLAKIARPPFLVPETKRLWELFREMRERKVHIALVVDEYGGTEGLVSLEDLLEELVGEIRDEHDLPEEEIVRVGPGEALVEANVRISEVNEQLGLELPEEEYETLGGLVTGLAEGIPGPGKQVKVGQVRVVVESGDTQRLERLRIFYPAPPP